MLAWLIGKPCDEMQLPARARELDQAKRQLGSSLPDLPYPLLSGLPLRQTHWRAIGVRQVGRSPA